MIRLNTLLPLLGLVAAVVGWTSSANAAVPDCSCPLDHYRDFQTNLCTPLEHPEYGFGGMVPVDFAPASSCSEVDVRTAIAIAAGNTGPTLVQLPPCTIVLTAPLELPSNIILAGAGADQTIITVDWAATTVSCDPEDPAYDPSAVFQTNDHVISAKSVSDVVIRDLQIDGAGGGCPKTSGITAYYSTNVAIERVWSHDHLGNGFSLGSDDVSLRCSRASDNGLDGNGKGVGFGQGSERVLVYSNTFEGNESIGLVYDGQEGEIADNQILDNYAGMKCQAGQEVSIHHNYFAGATTEAVKIHYDLTQSASTSSDITLHHNHFFDNDSYAVRVFSGLGIDLYSNLYYGNHAVTSGMAPNCPSDNCIRLDYQEWGVHSDLVSLCGQDANDQVWYDVGGTYGALSCP